ALTKKIVEAQGGRVGVQSTRGRGSLFHAVLPRNAEQKKEPRVEDFPSASSTTDAPKVLVIEDNDHDRNWLIKILTDAGYSVDTVMTGTEGIAKEQDNIYSAVLLDLNLPDTGGRDILHSIRAKGPNQSTPVIVVTVVAEKGVDQGFPIQDYLLKTINYYSTLRSF